MKLKEVIYLGVGTAPAHFEVEVMEVHCEITVL